MESHACGGGGTGKDKIGRGKEATLTVARETNIKDSK